MKGISVIVSVVLIVILGGFALIFFTKKDPSNPGNVTTEVQNLTPTISGGFNPSEDTKENLSRYSEYSKSMFERSSSRRRVLFFYANWCSTCRPADTSFKDNLDKIPEDVVLIRVNYNDTDTNSEEKALAKTYGITYQHTFVQIDENGREVTKWNGGQIEELLKNLK